MRMAKRAGGLACLLLSLACGEDPADGDSGGGGTGAMDAGPGTGGGAAAPDGAIPDVAPTVSCDTMVTDGLIVPTDPTNYTFTHTMSIETNTLRDATDLVFDWSAVTSDFFGHPVDPTVDIDMVLVTLWNQTPEQLEENMQQDNLPRRDNRGVVSVTPPDGATSANLLSFDILGNPITEEQLWTVFDTQNPDFQYPQDTHTFLVMAQTGTLVAKNVRMLSMFHLDPASPNTELRLTNESTVLDYTATLMNAIPIAVPARTPQLTIDWTELTVNALGNEYAETQITEAVVAHYPTLTRQDLEAEFLNLEELAEGWWSAEVSAGISMDLSTLVDAQGAPFPGVDESGIWLVALFCTASCNNPAPWSITFLQACPG